MGPPVAHDVEWPIAFQPHARGGGFARIHQAVAVSDEVPGDRWVVGDEEAARQAVAVGGLALFRD